MSGPNKTKSYHQRKFWISEQTVGKSDFTLISGLIQIGGLEILKHRENRHKATTVSVCYDNKSL